MAYSQGCFWPRLGASAANKRSVRVIGFMGDKNGALSTAREGVTAATAMHSDEYVRLNTEVVTEAGK